MKAQSARSSVEVVSDKSLLEIIREHTSLPGEDPFYIVDLGDVICKYNQWKHKMPRITPFYAVKCNSSPAILELLFALGAGFDCASKAEIEAAKKVGADRRTIIYANPCKTTSFIKHAASVGVDLMTFDNELELYKIKREFPSARMVLRIRVDDSSAVCRLGIKFGADLEACPRLLQLAWELGINVVGVSFHVGSGCQDANAYTLAIKNSYDVFQMGKSLGFNFTLLDIGGGFPGFHSGSGATFEEIANVTCAALDQYFPKDSGVDIIAEPGRFFVASAFTLCTNIIAKRELPVENDEGKVEMVTQYYVNDGVYGSFNCLVFDHALVTPIPLKDEVKQATLHPTTIWGPTCDSMDRILESCLLPDMNIGEWIIFENMGAYTIAATSSFNGFDAPALKIVLPLRWKLWLEKLPSWPRLSNALEFHDPSSPSSSSGNCHIFLSPEPVCA